MLGGLTGNIRQAFSKDIIVTGVGLFTTGTVTSLIFAKWGPTVKTAASKR